MSLRPLASSVCGDLPSEGGDSVYFSVLCSTQLGPPDPPTPLARRTDLYSSTCHLKHVRGKLGYRVVEGTDPEGRRVQTHDRNNDAEQMVPALSATRAPGYLAGGSVHALCRSRVARGFPFELPSVRAHVEGYCPSFDERSVPFEQMACGLSVVFAEAAGSDTLVDKPGEFILRSSLVFPYERASFCLHCSQLSSWTDAPRGLDEDAVRGSIKVTPAEYDVLTKVFCRHAVPKKSGSRTVHQESIDKPVRATRSSTRQRVYPVFFIDLKAFAEDGGKDFVTLDFTAPVRSASALGPPGGCLARVAAYIYENFVPFPRRFGVFVHPELQRLMVWSLDTSFDAPGLLRECFPRRETPREPLTKILRSVRAVRLRLRASQASRQSPPIKPTAPSREVEATGASSSSSSAAVVPEETPRERPPVRPLSPPTQPAPPAQAFAGLPPAPAAPVRSQQADEVRAASTGYVSLSSPSDDVVSVTPSAGRYVRQESRPTPGYDHYARFDATTDAIAPLPISAAEHWPRSRSRSPRRANPPSEVVAIPTVLLERAAASIRVGVEVVREQLQVTAQVLGYRYGSSEFAVYVLRRGLEGVLFDAEARIFRSSTPRGYHYGSPLDSQPILRPAAVREQADNEQDYNDLYGPTSQGSYVAPGVLHGDPELVRDAAVGDAQLSADETNPGSQTFQTAPSLPAWALFFAGVDIAPAGEVPMIPPQFEPRYLSFYGLLAGSRTHPDLSWIDDEAYVRGRSPEWQDELIERWSDFWKDRRDAFPHGNDQIRGCAETEGYNVLCTPASSGFVPPSDALGEFNIGGCVLVVSGLAAGPRNGRDTSYNGWVPFSYEILDWCLAGGLPVRAVFCHTEKAVVQGPLAMSRMKNEASLVCCCPAHASAAILRFAALNALRPLIPGRRLYVFRSDKAWTSPVRDPHNRWTGLTFEEVRAVLVSTFQAARARELGRVVPPDMLTPTPWSVEYWGCCTDEELARAQHQEAPPAFRLHYYARHAGSRDALLYLSAVANHFQDPHNPYRIYGPLTDTTIGSMLDEVTDCGQWISARGSRRPSGQEPGSPRVREVD